MNEIPSPCTDCKKKTCESPYNPDQECWTDPIIAQLIALGGKQSAELVEKLVVKKGETQRTE